MMFKVEFKTDSAAFDDNERLEIVRILTEVTYQVHLGFKVGAIRDVNGNLIGSWSLT